MVLRDTIISRMDLMKMSRCISIRLTFILNWCQVCRFYTSYWISYLNLNFYNICEDTKCSKSLIVMLSEKIWRSSPPDCNVIIMLGMVTSFHQCYIIVAKYYPLEAGRAVWISFTVNYRMFAAKKWRKSIELL